jgi:hypothetical protein
MTRHKALVLTILNQITIVQPSQILRVLTMTAVLAPVLVEMMG